MNTDIPENSLVASVFCMVPVPSDGSRSTREGGVSHVVAINTELNSATVPT